MSTYKVEYFVGSLSSTSINRLLAKALVKLAPPELVLTEIVIKDLPLYSQDFDADYPPVARAFKQATFPKSVISTGERPLSPSLTLSAPSAMVKFKGRPVAR